MSETTEVQSDPRPPKVRVSFQCHNFKVDFETSFHNARRLGEAVLKVVLEESKKQEPQVTT